MNEKTELYPDSMAVKQWQYQDAICYIVSHPRLKHPCGYARFEKRPVQTFGYDEIMTYVPVHGGITYAQQDEAGMTYGFDCAHAGDDEKDFTEEWLVNECQQMVDNIKAIVPFEDAYIQAEGDNESRAKIIDSYHESLGMDGFDIHNNFGAMINVICGRL